MLLNILQPQQHWIDQAMTYHPFDELKVLQAQETFDGPTEEEAANEREESHAKEASKFPKYPTIYVNGPRDADIHTRVLEPMRTKAWIRDFSNRHSLSEFRAAVKDHASVLSTKAWIDSAPPPPNRNYTPLTHDIDSLRAEMGAYQKATGDCGTEMQNTDAGCNDDGRLPIISHALYEGLLTDVSQDVIDREIWMARAQEMTTAQYVDGFGIATNRVGQEGPYGADR